MNIIQYGIAVVGIASLVGGPAIAGPPQTENKPTEISIKDFVYSKSGKVGTPSSSLDLSYVVTVTDLDRIREIYINGQRIIQFQDDVKLKAPESWSILYREPIASGTLEDYSVSIKVVDMLGDPKEATFFRTQ